MGANSAVFSIVDGVLLHPLPYPDREQLLRIRRTSQQAGNIRGNISEMDFLDFQAQNQVFSDIAAFNWTGGGVTLTAPDGPEGLRVISAVPDFSW